MAVRTILHYPDPRLREETRPIETVDDEIRALIDDMAETMYSAPGVGLAAPQIGVSLRLFIIDIADEDSPSELRVFINPEIVEKHGQFSFQEGCLSFPGIYEDVERAERVKVRAQDENGDPFELEAEGFLAVAIQHEYDHITGVLMLDHLGMLKKRMVHRKMLKQSRSR